MDDRNVAKTYVWERDGDRCFFVSTIEWDSSVYCETIAWEYDWKEGKRGRGVAEVGDEKLWAALEQHYRVVCALRETGRYDDEIAERIEA